MIRFSCPTCQKALKCPDQGAGKKVSCPRCGQRLLIPPPVQAQNKTVLGKLVPDSAPSSSIPPAGVKPSVAAPSPEQVQIDCPGCRSPFLIPKEGLGRWAECPKCGFEFAAMRDESTPAPSPISARLPPSPPPTRQQPSFDPFDSNSPIDDVGLEVELELPSCGPHSGRGQKHSPLGMASFIIGLVVGGLDVVLAVAIPLASLVRGTART
jgi:DNA-directed RNA polymerase subunit M/transcription elongation factor TFIIS